MSAQNLSQAVQAAIAENLNGVVAGELKSFIEKAHEQAKELERTQAAFKSVQAEVEQLRAKLSAHQELTARETALTVREATAQQKEIDLIKREAGIDAKIAQAELSGVKTSMDAFLRNVTIRTNVVSDVAKPVSGYPGGNGMGGGPGFLTRDMRPDSETTTRTEE
jgi:archaellum component FlaC